MAVMHIPMYERTWFSLMELCHYDNQRPAGTDHGVSALALDSCHGTFPVELFDKGLL